MGSRKIARTRAQRREVLGVTAHAASHEADASHFAALSQIIAGSGAEGGRMHAGPTHQKQRGETCAPRRRQPRSPARRAVSGPKWAHQVRSVAALQANNREHRAPANVSCRTQAAVPRQPRAATPSAARSGSTRSQWSARRCSARARRGPRRFLSARSPALA